MARHALAALLLAAATRGASADDQTYKWYPDLSGESCILYDTHGDTDFPPYLVDGAYAAFGPELCSGSPCDAATDEVPDPGNVFLADCCAEWYTQGTSDKFQTCLTTADTFGFTEAEIDAGTGGPAKYSDGTTPVATYLWRPDWVLGRCVRDCIETAASVVTMGGGMGAAVADACAGVIGPDAKTETTHLQVTACCSTHFPILVPEYCEALSMGAGDITAASPPYVGTGDFYQDSSGTMCYQDCDGSAPCNGVIGYDYVSIPFDTLDECCQDVNGGGTFPAPSPYVSDPTNPAYDADYEDYHWCMQTSGAPNPHEEDYTHEWYTDGSQCYLDCEEGPECKPAPGWIHTFYEDAEKCCTDGLGWQDPNWCKTRTDPLTYGDYTYKWYASGGFCKKDCDNGPDPTCEALGDTAYSIKLYDDIAACCSAEAGSNNVEHCEAYSATGNAEEEAGGDGKWYADYSTTQLCVRNCKTSGDPTCGGVVTNTWGVNFYDDVEDCCGGKFGWYFPEACKVLSFTGGKGYTSMYYANYQTGICDRDCEESTGNGCEGHPQDRGTKLYEDFEDCCDDKLGWTAKPCKMKTQAILDGQDPDKLAGTMEWRVDYENNKCVLDCDPDNTDVIALFADDAANPAFQSGGANYGITPEDVCGGVSTGTSTQFFEQAAVNTNALDAEDCCEAKHSWIASDLCAAMSVGQYSYSYWPDQGKMMCVQHCEENDSNSATPELCGGNPTEKIPGTTYDNVEDCCETMPYANQAECTQDPALLVGNNKYWIDWSISKCVKNCPETSNSDPECGGLAPGAWNTLYDSSTDCCNQPAFNNVKKSDCVKS